MSSIIPRLLPPKRSIYTIKYQDIHQSALGGCQFYIDWQKGFHLKACWVDGHIMDETTLMHGILLKISTKPTINIPLKGSGFLFNIGSTSWSINVYRKLSLSNAWKQRSWILFQKYLWEKR